MTTTAMMVGMMMKRTIASDDNDVHTIDYKCNRENDIDDDVSK